MLVQSAYKLCTDGCCILFCLFFLRFNRSIVKFSALKTMTNDHCSYEDGVYERPPPKSPLTSSITQNLLVAELTLHHTKSNFCYSGMFWPMKIDGKLTKTFAALFSTYGLFHGRCQIVEKASWWILFKCIQTM